MMSNISKQMFKRLIGLGVLLIVSGCQTPSPSSAPALMAGQYQLISINQVAPTHRISFQVREEAEGLNISLRGGCNILNLSARLSGASLETSGVRSTRMACKQASRMQLDQALTSALGEQNFSVSMVGSHQLTLTSVSNTLVLERQ